MSTSWVAQVEQGEIEVREIMGLFKIDPIVKDWESDILKHLRVHDAIIAKDTGIEKFDVYNESWLRVAFPATSLKELRAMVLDEGFELGKTA